MDNMGSEKKNREVECSENIGKLFFKNLSSGTSQELKTEIDNCYSDSKAINQFERIWNISGKLKAYKEIDRDAALKTIKQKAQATRGISPKGFLFYLERVAAVLFLPLLIASLSYYFINKPAVELQSSFNEIDNAYGTVSKLTLPDGTKVWLNSGSHFKYPLSFSNKVRKVYLSGEAYFEVSKNKRKPFVVATSDVDVMATGTVFNVMAYDNEDNIEATLVSGKISMAKETASSIIPTPIMSVNPGQKAILNKKKKKIAVTNVDVTKIISWKEGKLIFENDPMDVVIKKLDRWYNTNIILVDDELRTYSYTATFTGETLVQILELLKYSAPIEYTIFPRKKNDNNTFSKGKIEIRLQKGYKKKFSKK
jgi:ferric-dicitrate binding protein FerR (iron transport regulator)